MHLNVCITPATIAAPKINKLNALKNINMHVNTLFNSHHHPCLDVHIILVMLVYYQVSIPISTCVIKFLHDSWFSKPIDNSVHFDSSYFSKNERRCKWDMNPHLWYGDTSALLLCYYASLLIIIIDFSASYSGLFIGKFSSLFILIQL